ncbi:hypothetical protein V6N13_060033 [Hibiscus sabdariffa]|uniref:Glutathione S-transferase n=1 Tax=Hibiscus sabdariffa TaxID=183260 RepID=A0ABR2GCD0_9ROSI
MGDEVKVFGFWGSPFSRRVELALLLKGVPYEYVEEDIFVVENKSPLLLQYNPVHKKVPVLLHNGKPIAESLVILEYIEETWKANPILPEDPYDKAMARFWAKFLDDKCLPAIRKAAFSPENEREEAAEEARACLKTLESALNGKRVMQEVTGEELLSVEKLPELFKWTEEFVSCSVVKQSLPPKDKVLGVVKARVAQTNAPK